MTDRSTQERFSGRVKLRRRVERRENYCKEVRSGTSEEYVYESSSFPEHFAVYSQVFEKGI